MQAAGFLKLQAAAGLFIHFFKYPTPIAVLRCPCSGSSPCTFWPTLFCKSLLGFASLFFSWSDVFKKEGKPCESMETSLLCFFNLFLGWCSGLSCFFNFFWCDSLTSPFSNGKASCPSSGLFCTSFKRSANCVYSRPVSMLTSRVGAWPFQLSQVCQQDIHPLSPCIAPHCPIMATGVEQWLVCQESEHGIPQWLGVQFSLWGYFDQVLQQTQAIYEPLRVRCRAT